MTTAKPARARKKDRPESVVLKECLEALHAAFYPGFFWRQNNGKVQTKGLHWVVLCDVKGIADIVGFIPTPYGARIIFVECKKCTGKLREDQVRFRERVRTLGGICVEARTGAEAVAGVKLGLQTPVPGSLPPAAVC